MGSRSKIADLTFVCLHRSRSKMTDLASLY
ncbi:hypothetical protein F383_00234 [Gossypium arboreum]|uniref:Uncharacterized protein n=1 Tax=Gossypium arboreum TaxID=29729 RepID=A0A0B0NH17_GOSAR|nr:hypothetical protein F383_00234 [Gossypium arboreum]